MPELPDLEVFKGNIFGRLSDKKLVDVTVYNMQKCTAPQEFLNSELGGRELTAIDRFGKELLFRFGEGRVVAAHLMLSGRIAILDEQAEAQNINHKIFALNFTGETIVFSDVGGLCTVKYNPSYDGVPDAFGENFTLGYFQSIGQKKANTNVKAFLIDQKVVKGIGNAYADEILWRAKVSPHSVVGKIPPDIFRVLYYEIEKTLKEAVGAIRAFSPDIISGEERRFLQVHTKLKKQTDNGFPIQVERIVSKTTYFTAEQVVYK